MKKIALALTLSLVLLALPDCSGFNPFATFKNPVSKTDLYASELLFDGGLKTFNKSKDLCGRRILPPDCRTYVLKGQDIIPKIYAADLAAHEFITKNPTFDAGDVIQEFIDLVSNFDTTVSTLKTMK